MSELAVGSIAGLASNGFVVDVASGSQLTQPGMILQVVRATDSTERATTSTSFVDVTGMSVTITPKKSDSTIVVCASAGLVNEWTTTTGQVARLQLTDSSNVALSGAEDLFIGSLNLSGSGTRLFYVPVSLVGYSSPETTSPVTYKMRFKRNDANLNVVTITNQLVTGQIYAIEVAT